MREVEIITDGRTVWVNDSAGCIGRFGKHGVDVHRSYADQIATGSECLDCFHGGTPAEQWERFVGSMQHFHGVEISSSFRPSWT